MKQQEDINSNAYVVDIIIKLVKIEFLHVLSVEFAAHGQKDLYFQYLYKQKLNLRFKKNFNGYKIDGMTFIYQNITLLLK